MQMDWPFFAITEEPLKSDCVVLRLTLWALMKKLGDQKSQWGWIKTEQISLCLSSLWFAPNQVKLIHNHLRSESQPQHLGDFFWGWKSWSQRTGAIYLFFIFFCLAVKLMVTHYCTKPIWAQLVPLMLSVELLPIKMIVWVSNAPFRSCPRSLPLTIFVHVCPFSCPRRWDLYIQGRFSSNPPYLIVSNLLGCAHGRRKSFRDIWYSPTLSRHWNKLIFTFFWCSSSSLAWCKLLLYLLLWLCYTKLGKWWKWLSERKTTFGVLI